MSIRSLEWIALSAVLFAMGFGFLQLGSAGGLVVRPFLPAACGLILVSLFSGDLRRGINGILQHRDAWMFYAFYVATIFAQLVAAAHHGMPRGATTSLIKGMIYATISFCLAACIVPKLQRPDGSRWLLRAAIWGSLGFAAFFTLKFAAAGKNLFAMYAQDLLSGNESNLKFKYYPRLFQTGSVETKTSLRNSFVTGFVIYLGILLACRETVVGFFRRRWVDLSVLVCVLLVMTSVSRINIVAMLITLGLGIAGRILSNRRSAKNLLAISLLLAGFGVGFGVIVLAVSPKAAALVQERFGGDVANDGRISVARKAIIGQDEHWLWGRGFGTPLEGEVAKRVHHYAIGLYYESGLVGLLPALLTMGTLLLMLYRGFRSTRRRKIEDSGVRPVWWVAMPAIVFLRMNISGDCGQVAVADWIGLALFVAAIATEDVAHR